METTLTLDPAKRERALTRVRRRHAAVCILGLVVFGVLTRIVYAWSGAPIAPSLFAVDLCIAGALFAWATLGQSRRQTEWQFARLRIHFDEHGIEKEWGTRPGTRLAWEDVASVHASPERGWLLRSKSGALLRVPAEVQPAEPWRVRVASLPQQPWTADAQRATLIETKRSLHPFRSELRPRRAWAGGLGGVGLMLLVHLAASYLTSPR